MFLIYVKTGLEVVDDLLNKPFFANSITLLPICLYFTLLSKLLTILQLFCLKSIVEV